METREQRILKSLLKFFSNDANFKILLDIVVLKNKNIPLRVLDWFVTNYAKKNDVTYNIVRSSSNHEIFSVYRNYRSQLKGYKKKEFDPFCRGNTIMLEYESPVDGTKLQFETGLCQLKFFKWAIENLVIDYVESHYDEIYQDMKANTIKSGNGKTNKKKLELSKSIYKQINISKIAVTLSFPQSVSQ